MDIKKMEQGNNDRAVIVGLFLLSTIPIFAGVTRLGQLLNGHITPENFRFHSSPAPVVMHIIAVTIYSLLGAFQFSNGFRK